MTPRQEAEYRVLASLGKTLDMPEFPDNEKHGDWRLEFISFAEARRLLTSFNDGTSSLWTKKHDQALNMLLDRLQHQENWIQSLMEHRYQDQGRYGSPWECSSQRERKAESGPDSLPQ